MRTDPRHLFGVILILLGVLLAGAATAGFPLTVTGGAGGGITFDGGGTVTGSSGALSATASGTNQNVTVTPSGSGDVVFQLSGTIGSLVNVAAASQDAAIWHRVTGGGGGEWTVGIDHSDANAYVWVNASSLTGTNMMRLSTAGALTVAGPVIGAVQALSGAGAVNVTQQHTDFTSTGGAQALTLADGAAGQEKTITHVVDGGSGVLTPTTKVGFSTITFTAAGESVRLRYTSAGWAVVGSYGATIAP